MLMAPRVCTINACEACTHPHCDPVVQVYSIGFYIQAMIKRPAVALCRVSGDQTDLIAMSSQASASFAESLNKMLANEMQNSNMDIAQQVSESDRPS